MKTFYLVIFLVCVAGLILVCIPPVPSNLSLVDRLAECPDKWKLTLNDPEHKIFREDEESARVNLLRFIIRHRHPYWADVAWVASGLAVAASFSVLGWRREREFEKRSAVSKPK